VEDEDEQDTMHATSLKQSFEGLIHLVNQMPSDNSFCLQPSHQTQMHESQSPYSLNGPKHSTNSVEFTAKKVRPSLKRIYNFSNSKVQSFADTHSEKDTPVEVLAKPNCRYVLSVRKSLQHLKKQQGTT